MKFAIIGDDLSGSNDTAVTFSNQGYKSYVLNYPEAWDYKLSNCDILAISTNSREMGKEQAREVVREACKYIKKYGVTGIYKKIDSTWRGNIGVEIEAVMEVMDFQLAIITSSFPQMGRTVKDGSLFINGVPLEDTPISKDPGFPLKESYLPNILRDQTTLPIRVINHEIVSKGVVVLIQNILEIAKEGRAMILIDAITEKDLDTISAIDQKQLPSMMFCGSAGLSASMIKNSRLISLPKAPPVLIVVGSVHPQNNQLIEYLKTNTTTRDIFLDPLQLINGETDYINTEKIEEYLKEGFDIVIKTFRNEDDRSTVKELSQAIGMTELQASCSIAIGLQKFVKRILTSNEFSGLILTGGTTALHILRGIKGAGVRLYEEIEPGVPYGKILGGPMDGLGLITKAGSFGSNGIFARGIKYLKVKFMLERE